MNIREVAKKAGVSTATVSRVVNGTAPVDAQTEKRVRAAIARTGYYPNTHARTLGTGKSHIYGMIISDIENPFFPELVKCFERIAVEHGHEVLIANTDYRAERMEVCVRRMLERKVDGVAIMTSEMDSGAHPDAQRPRHPHRLSRHRHSQETGSATSRSITTTASTRPWTI